MLENNWRTELSKFSQQEIPLKSSSDVRLCMKRIVSSEMFIERKHLQISRMPCTRKLLSVAKPQLNYCTRAAKNAMKINQKSLQICA